MTTTEELMIEKINRMIANSVKVFNELEEDGRTWDEKREIMKGYYSGISGMINMMELATGKRYSYNVDGVYEIK